MEDATLPYEPYIFRPDEAPDAACDRCSYWTGPQASVDDAIAVLAEHHAEEHHGS